MLASRILHHLRGQSHRRRPVGICRLDRTGLHHLKPNNKDTIDGTIPHERPRHMQSRRASRAGIVGVVDGDAAHAELVEDPLPTRRLTVAIASHTRLHVVVVDAGVQHGFHARLVPHLDVVASSTGLDELRHPHAEDVGVRLWSFRHFGGVCRYVEGYCTGYENTRKSFRFGRRQDEV